MRHTRAAIAILASGAVARADVAQQCQSYLFEPPGPEYLAFGTATLDGDRVVIAGFIAADPRQRTFIGRSHIYTRINTAAGTEFSKPYVLHDPYGEIDSGFGRGPSLAGTELVIGAPGSSLVTQGQGAAYVYELVGEDWLLRQQLTPPRDDEALAFGYRM